MDYIYSFMSQFSQSSSPSLKKVNNDKYNVIAMTGTNTNGVLSYLKRSDDSLNTASVFKFIDELKSFKDQTKPLYIKLRTVGGSMASANIMCRAIHRYRTLNKTKVIVEIVDYALSAGTIVALCCDEIIMDNYSVLGDIGVISYGFDTRQLKKVLDYVFPETENKVSSKNFIEPLLEYVENMGTYGNEITYDILKNYSVYSNDNVQQIYYRFNKQNKLHDCSFDYYELKDTCMNVTLKNIDIKCESNDKQKEQVTNSNDLLLSLLKENNTDNSNISDTDFWPNN